MQGHADFESLTLPAEHLVLMRSVMLLIGLLGMLEASNSWFSIAREWLYDEPPVTELGMLGGGPPRARHPKLRGEMSTEKRPSSRVP